MSDLCQHACEVNEETLRRDREHFLDCPVWQHLLTGRTATSPAPDPVGERGEK